MNRRTFLQTTTATLAVSAIDLLQPPQLKTVLTTLLLAPLAVLCAGEPERVGPPTFFMQDSIRYVQRVPDESHRHSYPIPVTPVTRETYMAWLENSGLLDYVSEPKRGLAGPAELLPVLAKFAQTGEPKWGEACVTMLKDFHRALKQEDQPNGVRRWGFGVER
jgi:hypothetical protein